MKLSDIKNLINKLESSGVDESFDLKFVATVEPEQIELPSRNRFSECTLKSKRHGLDILDFEIDNSKIPFDIGHSDKCVNIFLNEI